jgi:hypothetical protein
MNGVAFADICAAIVEAFDGLAFDRFLRERFDLKRPKLVPNGAFQDVVSGVVEYFEQRGLEAALLAEVAAERPMNGRVQDVYRSYALGLVDQARSSRVADETRKALERFGVVPLVRVQTTGIIQDAEPVLASAPSLERLVRADLPLLEAGLWLQRLFELKTRVCRVEIGGAAVGTGFLVGPDTVLTNHHVIQGVLEGGERATDVRFRFDHEVLATGAVTDGISVGLHPGWWALDHTPCTAGESRGALDPYLPSCDELDHALLRLEREVGHEPLVYGAHPGSARGWIHVPESEPATPKGMPLIILQHALGGPLKIAFDTRAVLNTNENRTRLRYATNTEPGSSGSPCFDVHGTLVALHHYGDPARGHTPGFNQGIPIHRIRERLKRKARAATAGGTAVKAPPATPPAASPTQPDVRSPRGA